MRERLHVIGFMLVMTIVFGGMVATVNAFLKERIERNRKVASYRAILEAFGTLKVDDERGAIEIVELYEKSVRQEGVDTDALFVLSSEPRKQAFYLVGDAYWGPLKGVMAVDLDTKKVLGIAFIDHTETPGLGARIDEPEFRNQFPGLSYAKKKTDGERLTFVASGTANSDEQQVDMITGATETSRALAKIIQRNLTAFLEKAGVE